MPILARLVAPLLLLPSFGLALDNSRRYPDLNANEGVIQRLQIDGVKSTSDASSLSAKATGSVFARTHAARAADAINVKDYGAIGDGNSHPLSERYATLAAAQAVCPTADTLTVEIDWCAIQAAINTGRPVRLPDGFYSVNRTLVQTKNGGMIYGESSQSLTQIRRRGDFGPTLLVGGTTPAVFNAGISNIAFYDFGAVGQTMTQVSSPFHIVFDNTQAPRIENVLVASALSASNGGGIKIAGSIDHQITGLSIALQNGVAAGKIGLLITRSKLPGAQTPDGGGKADLNRVNIEGGILHGTPATSLVSYLDEGIRVENGDGLWMDNVHIQGTTVANLRFATFAGRQLSNIFMTNMMLDITNGHGLAFDGDGRIDRLDFSGRISSADLGLPNMIGISSVAEVHNASFDVGVDGFKATCIVWNNAASADLIFRLRTIKNCNTGNTGNGGINLIAGQRFSFYGGNIGGDNKLAFMLQAGPEVNGLNVVGISGRGGISGSFGYIFKRGANNISVSGGSMLEVTTPIADQTGAGALIKLRGVLGVDDITKPAP